MRRLVRETGAGNEVEAMAVLKGTRGFKRKNIATAPTLGGPAQAVPGLMRASSKGTGTVTTEAMSAMVARGDSAASAVAAVAAVHGSEEVRSSINRCRS